MTAPTRAPMMMLTRYMSGLPMVGTTKMPLELIAKVSNLSLEKVRELGQMHSLL